MSERWATFDCYGTLIDWNRGIAAALEDLWPGEDVLDEYHRQEPLTQKGRAISYRQVLAETVVAVGAAKGLPLSEGDELRLPASLPSWPPFDEVPSSLRELRERGWRTAVLSNCDADLLAASLERIGVPFDLTITVEQAGSYKPAHGHWKAFFATTGASPSRHVHVGASIFHDMAPAAALGLNAVWINRLGERDTHTPRAAELSDLRGLAGTLEEIAKD